MVRLCYLCKKRASITDNISLHGFPRNLKIRKKWLNACGLNTNDNVRGICICSRHFRPEDICQSNIFGRVKSSIKRDAVPTLDLTNPLNIDESEDESNKSPSKTPLSELFNENGVANQSFSFSPDNNIVDESNAPDSMEKKEYIELHSVEVETSNNSSINADLVDSYEKCNSNLCTENSMAGSSSKGENTVPVGNNSPNQYRRRKFFEPRYVNEISALDFATPKRAKRTIHLIKTTDQKKSHKIELLQRQTKHLLKRVESLQDLINHLKENRMLSNESGDALMSMMPEDLTNIKDMKVKDGRGYTPQVRSFALSLHFYSPKAYKYVREKFNKQLPSISTIKSWYRVVSGSPGFTDESFKAIEIRCKEKCGIVNLVLDEMSIKEEIIYDKKEFHGGINFGTLQDFGSAYSDNDNPITAKNVLVLMAVSMNENWKIAIAYFLVRSLSGEERANILTLAFELLHKANCKVYSITFDGAASNVSMCHSLGANLNYGPNFKPYFTNPATLEICYIFYDFCHMIKLIRNTLGDHKIIKTANGKSILWSYIEKLYELQCKEGLTVANKLTKKHVYYQNNKMNVKLAIQTLSESVSKALQFLELVEDGEIRKDFKNSSETALFCLNFNNIGDMLNCKNRFSKAEFDTPLTNENYLKMKEHAMRFENYIINLYSEFTDLYTNWIVDWRR